MTDRQRIPSLWAQACLNDSLPDCLHMLAICWLHTRSRLSSLSQSIERLLWATNVCYVHLYLAIFDVQFMKLHALNSKASYFCSSSNSSRRVLQIPLREKFQHNSREVQSPRIATTLRILYRVVIVALSVRPAMRCRIIQLVVRHHIAQSTLA